MLRGDEVVIDDQALHSPATRAANVVDLTMIALQAKLCAYERRSALSWCATMYGRATISSDLHRLGTSVAFYEMVSVEC